MIYVYIYSPIFIMLFLASSLEAKYYDILNFIFIFFVFLCSFMAGASDAMNGITSQASVMKNGGSTLSIKFSKYLTMIFYAISVIGLFVLYSTKFYPLLPQSIGGARPNKITIYLEKDTLNVNLINESTTWFLLQKPDSTIIKIKSTDVKKVRLIN